MSFLPPTLVRFESQFEQAIRRHERSRRARVRLLRVAVAGAAAAAVALGLLSTLPGAEPSLVARAASAFAVGDDTILHFDIVGRQMNPDGSTVTWRSESWQDRSAPYARRAIEARPEGVPAETASVGRRTELYDARTNTIYVAEEPEPERPRLSPGPRPGTSVVTVTKWLVLGPDQEPRARRERVVMSTAKAKKLVRRSKREEFEPGPVEEPFRRDIMRLLRSGAVADGEVQIDGRDALLIASRDGRTTYIVEPGTYAPIELRTRGTGGGVTLSFRTYEELPRTAANRALLSLSARHPTARINRDPADYRAAQRRLFPHG